MSNVLTTSRFRNFKVPKVQFSMGLGVTFLDSCASDDPSGPVKKKGIKKPNAATTRTAKQQAVLVEEKNIANPFRHYAFDHRLARNTSPLLGERQDAPVHERHDDVV